MRRNLQISDTFPEKGLQLPLAMGWYGDQHFAQNYPSHEMLDVIEGAARYSERHHLRPEDASYVDPSSVPAARIRADARHKVLLNDIASQLRAGKLYATGLRVGEFESVTIPRQWWNVATLTPETNSAEGNGVTFMGLLVFEADSLATQEPSPNISQATEPLQKPIAEPAQSDPPISDLIRKWTSEEVTTWFEARVAKFKSAPQHPSEKEDCKAGLIEFPGVTRAIIRSLRNDFVSKDRRKQGRRSKQSANLPSKSAPHI